MSLRAAIAEAASVPKRLKRRWPEVSGTERAARALPVGFQGSAAQSETQEALLRRIRRVFAAGEFEQVRRRDLRRLVDCIWLGAEYADIASACVEAIAGSSSRGLHRRMVEAYLRRFPEGHAKFGDLCRGLDRVARAKKSAWAGPSQSWKLFNPVAGPQTVGAALLRLPPHEVLASAGLTGELASGGFSRAAWRCACAEVAECSAEAAPERVRTLVSLADALGDLPAERAHYVRALLKPWASGAPSPALKRFVIGELVGRIGDPRLDRSRWQGVQKDLQAAYPNENAGKMIDGLRFWLVENAVHQFLDVVDHDADPEQWPYRKAFWLSYLKAGHVKDAWVAFGPAAADRARDLTESSKSAGRLYADLTGGYQASQSVLVMRIDTLLVGDWSHTGQCRFWTPESKAGSRLQNPDGSWRSSYSAAQLRTLDVHHPGLGAKAVARARAERLRATRPDHEEPHGGSKSYTWQRKFNEVIEELTDSGVHFEYDSLYPHERSRAWEPASVRPRPR